MGKYCFAHTYLIKENVYEHNSKERYSNGKASHVDLV